MSLDYHELGLFALCFAPLTSSDRDPDAAFLCCHLVPAPEHAFAVGAVSIRVHFLSVLQRIQEIDLCDEGTCPGPVPRGWNDVGMIAAPGRHGLQLNTAN